MVCLDPINGMSDPAGMAMAAGEKGGLPNIVILSRFGGWHLSVLRDDFMATSP